MPRRLMRHRVRSGGSAGLSAKAQHGSLWRKASLCLKIKYAKNGASPKVHCVLGVPLCALSTRRTAVCSEYSEYRRVH